LKTCRKSKKPSNIRQFTKFFIRVKSKMRDVLSARLSKSKGCSQIRDLQYLWWMSEGGRKVKVSWMLKIWYFTINVSVDKCFSLCFRVVKMIFYYRFSPGKILLVIPWKNPLLALPGKSLSDTHVLFVRFLNLMLSQGTLIMAGK